MKRLSACVAAFAVAAIAASPASAETLLATLSASAAQVAVNPVTNKAYVGSAGWLGATGVTVIDGATGAMTSIGTGKRAGYIAVNPVTNRIYVANGNTAPTGSSNNPGNDVTVIDGATNATTTVAVGGNACGIAVNPATNRVYVAAMDTAQVTVIDGATNSTSTVRVGTNPCAVAVNPVTNKIYVANRGNPDFSGSSVTIIDGASGATKTLATSAVPAGIAIDPAANKVYVATYYGSDVSVIDGATDSVTAVVPTSLGSSAIVANPATHKIYVANHGFTPGATCCVPGTTGNVSVIDGATNTAIAVGTDAIRNPAGLALDAVTNTVYVMQGDRFGGLYAIDGDTNATRIVPGPSRSAGGIAVNPVTNVLYATNAFDGLVHVVDANTYSTTDVALGISPADVVENPMTGKTYVCGSSLKVIDGATNVVTTVPTPCQALGVNPATNRIYVNDGNGNLVVVNGTTDTVATSIFFGLLAPVMIAVNEFTNRIYVATASPGNVVLVYDGATNTRISTVTLGGSAGGIAVNRRTNRIYVSINGAVDVIDGASNTVTAIPNGGRTALNVAVNEATNRIYAANYANGSVSVIDGGTASVTAVVPVGANPRSVAVNAVTNTVYVGNSGGNTVTAIDGASNAATAVNVGSAPFAIAVDAVNNKVYTANSGSNNVTVIDGASRTTATIPSGTQPLRVAVNPANGKVHVSNAASGSVTAIMTARSSLANHALALSGGNVAAVSEPNLTLAMCCAYAPNDPAPLAAYYRLGDATGAFTAIPGGGPTFTASAVPLQPGLNFVKAFVLDRMGDGEYPAGTPLVGAPVVLPVVSLAPLWTTPSPLPAATPGTPYTQVLAAVGGPFTFTLSAGALPPGLSLSADGTISGVPTADGFFTFTVTVTNGSGGTATRVFAITSNAAGGTREVGVSTRMQVLAGDDVLIGGFAIGGNGARKTVVVRARGPSLASSGIANPLVNPVLQLFSGAGMIASNDDWQAASNAAVIRASGFAPPDPNESAILMTLDSGLYTAIVSGAGSGTGVGLVEVYEIDHPEVPLTAISTRGRVQTGDNVMIGGFVISGTTAQTVVVRARGPSLASAGIADPLVDPMLTLVGNGVSITNDDWVGAPNAAQIRTSGFAPRDSRESAILVTLNPGAYTAIVSGVNGTTGVGIVEVFAQ